MCSDSERYVMSSDSDDGAESDPLLFRRNMYFLFTRSLDQNNDIKQIKPSASFYYRERYLLIRKVERIILDKNITIFGGYLRDMILHHYGAKDYFDNVSTETSQSLTAYTDATVCPDSFVDRNTYPNDIDCFVDNKDKITSFVQCINSSICGVRVIEAHTVRNYTHHPNFTSNFKCTRYKLEYVYNSSFQKMGTTISVFIDFVENVSRPDKGPWHYVTDAACNMLYMDNIHGLCLGGHTCTSDPIENAMAVSSMLKLIQKRVTFVPPMPYMFRCPSDSMEISNISVTHNMTDSQARLDFISNAKRYRSIYRMKYLQRIYKLVLSGWRIVNLDIKIEQYTVSDNGEGDVICAISHEEFSVDQVVVRLGQSNPVSNSWVQSSVLSWESFVSYIFSNAPGVEDAFAGKTAWEIICPISKNHIKVFELRPYGLLLRHANHCTM